MLKGLSGMVSAPKGACKWIEGEASSEFRNADPVKFRELVGSLGLDYEEEYWPIMYKLVGSWSIVLLMSPRQGETNQHRGMKCDMVDWVSRKCLCETVAWAAPLHERVGPCQMVSELDCLQE